MLEASSVDVSPDGNYVYVTSSGSNAINVFNKNASSPVGQLTFVETYVSGVDGIMGLTGAQSVSVSPDGNQVYVVGQNDDALVTFNRSHLDGRLTFVSMHRDGLNGVDGLNAAYQVKVSPDGEQVYVTAIEDNSISVFDRNITSGQLTFQSKVTKPGITSCVGFDISDDGKHVYVTANLESKVLIFSRNLTTGALTFVSEIENSVNFVNGISGAFSAFVSPDGNNVYVTGANNNAVTVFDRNANDGTLTYQTMHEDGQNGINFMGFPVEVKGSNDGNYVYVVGSMDNAINVFERNTLTGALTFKEAMVEGTSGVSGMNFPINIAVSDDDSFVYTASEGSGAAVVFQVESNGSLNYIENQATGTGGVSGLTSPYGVTVSPDGNHVYAASFGDDALVVFERASDDGDLTYVSKAINGVDNVSGLDRVYSVIVSPDGKHVYAAANNDDAVTIFERNAMTGDLTFINKVVDNTSGVDGLNGARFVTISPDGNFVYATGYFDDAIAVFSRNSTSGLLTFVQIIKDGLTADGLNGANSVVISDDGLFAYSTGYVDDAVSLFSRDPSTGMLTYVERYVNGTNNVNGLNGASSVILSKDGMSVYACGFNDASVVAFSRNPATGTLTYVNRYKDGINGVDGLTGVRAVALNPDGQHFYAVSGGENAIALFERNATTSALSYQTKEEDGINNINGLSGSRQVIVSPFGRHIYVAGADDDAIAVFSCTYFDNMVEEICEGSSITIGNNTYTEAGFYETVIADTYGCQTSVTLELSVLQTSETINQSICQGEQYELGNQSYSTSGTYLTTYMNDQGCEVQTTLNLVVTNVPQTSMTAEICEGETYSVGNNTFFESGIYQNNLTSVDGCDSTVTLTLVVNETGYAESATICSGDQFAFGSQVLTSSGSYQESFAGSDGCDSIVTLQLSVVNGYNEFISQTICEGASYAFGSTTVSEAGTYTETFTSIGGCDSMVVLTLAVEQEISILINETICNGDVYDFGGLEYGEAGLYTQNITSVNGCDSIVTLNLSVLPGAPSDLNEAICAGSSYSFGGNVYTESGTYASTFVSPNGCESLVTLTLDVVESIEVTVEADICEGESYPFGNQNLTQPGTYVGNFNTLEGCDSTVTLILTTEAVPTTTLFETICNGDIYEIGGLTYASTGTYNTILTSTETGCDSIVELNLTVVDINAGALITNDDGSGTGAINISVSNGLPPYSFEWSNGEETEDLTGLGTGTYSVLVSDANGCTETFVYTIESTNSIFNPFEEATFDATLYPNPTSPNSDLTLVLTNDENQMFEIKLYDSVGKLVNQQRVNVKTGTQTETLIAPQNAGLYFLQIINENNESKNLKVIIH